MKVNIGVLKNALSRYLKLVRNGDEITITDRNEPIARIIPLEKKVIRADFREWLRKNPPVKPRKKQIPADVLVRQIRDEE